MTWSKKIPILNKTYHWMLEIS
nr:unnamed protein product [Callosobruchus analis]